MSGPPRERIRRAAPEEADELGALALRSKALWGYDAAFMAACRAPLTVTPEYVARAPVYVLERDGTRLGFYGLDGAPPRGEVEFFFVEPDAVGRGCGRRLFRHMAAVARRAGMRQLVVLSDPNAEPFYAAMGATRTGWAPSDAVPGRFLPLLLIALSAPPHARPSSGASGRGRASKRVVRK